MAMSERSVVLGLYRSLLAYTKSASLRHAWTHVVPPSFKATLCGVNDVGHCAKFATADAKGAMDLIRSSFRQSQDLPAGSPTIVTAIDRGLEALRVFNALRAVVSLREERLDSSVARHQVGTVIQHRRYGYKGLIFGWDPTCQRPKSWVEKNRVDDLEHGANQVFYHVLPDESDGQPRNEMYVAQDNIVEMPLVQIYSRSQSRLFPKGYSKGLDRYIPSQTLRYIFPGTSCDDEDEELVPNERIEKECKENWKARLVTI
ncbi:hypothetical protein KFL_002290100 [Klebsormidium nitens]|uniref:Hemimethylated DNA-binding domain-containing protein n=1 Tax=Klebsormidium nitens TaxID=105231 RepID=A0A1Y1I7B8_KLENI|nr:hypothetical protein KFL_002290100 [Klebsormidium nitens]|eukprot:GAQ85319.1 hypothetical protein KFL_002290100 [Klebsormidium nitens]